MADDVWTRQEIESPCVKICVIHPETGLCTGCLRTLSEISDWSGLSQDARREVILALPDREGLHKIRRGGRAGRQSRRKRLP